MSVKLGFSLIANQRNHSMPFFPLFLVLEWFLEKHVHMSVKLGISLVANTQAQLGEAMNLLWSLTGAWLTQATISSKSSPTNMCDDS